MLFVGLTPLPLAFGADVTVVEEIVCKVNGDIITRGELEKDRRDLENEFRQQGLTGRALQDAVSAKAREIQNSAIIVDTHADTPQRLVDENYDLASPLNGGQVNFDAAKQGNLGAEFFSIWVEPDLYKGDYAKRTLELIDSVYQQAAKHPNKMQMAFSSADILAAHRNHKLAALMGIEGGHSIEDSLPLLRDYYRLGVRYMTLTWSNSLDWADSSGVIDPKNPDDPKVPHTKEGLTEFGKDVVYEMNRLGMMVDISHVADETFYRTLVITRAPVIASHSAARALCDAPRNMTDDMLRAVAINGGVVQVNFYSGFISQAYRDASKAQQPEVDKAVQKFKDKAKAEGKDSEKERNQPARQAPVQPKPDQWDGIREPDQPTEQPVRIFPEIDAFELG